VNRVALAALALAGAVFATVGYVGSTNAASPLPGDPCAHAPCQITGAAVRVTIPLQPSGGKVVPKVTVGPLVSPEPKAAPVLLPGHFLGKLALVVEERGGCGPHPTEPCKMEDCSGRTCWAVERPFTYRTHAGDLITVPAGMTTDLASVPRFAWSLVPPDGLWIRAAVVHDFLYRSAGSCVIARVNRTSTCSRARPYERAEADAIIDQGMADIGIGMAARVTIWSGVRAGGHNGWGH
jgi:hypothetical protein